MENYGLVAIVERLNMRDPDGFATAGPEDSVIELLMRPIATAALADRHDESPLAKPTHATRAD